MIVVVGLPAYADSPDGERCAGGLAVEIAAAAVRRGGTVELVGKVGNDGAGDAVVVALGRMGVGHAALLRDPVLPTPVFAAAPVDDDATELDADVPVGRLLPEDPASRPALEAADVDLALKFLPQAGVIGVAGLEEELDGGRLDEPRQQHRGQEDQDEDEHDDRSAARGAREG